MKYDIFISYKRKGTSSATAAYLYELLQQKGYNVFFDRKEMRSGKFNEQILEHISNATDILILLEQESLGSWFDYRGTKQQSRSIGNQDSSIRFASGADFQEEPYKTDWFCREIMHALSLEGKNIVPILLNGYLMPEGKDLPPEMAELSLHNALSLEISEIEEFYEKHLVEQGYLKSKPVNLSLTKRFQSKGGVVGCFLLFTDVDSCDLYECGEKIVTLTDSDDEWHPFRYPVNFAGEHRFRAINNDSCEVVTIRCSVETNCQQYVQIKFTDTRDLWQLTKEEITAQDDVERLYNWGRGLFDGTTKHEPDITLSFECLKRAIDLGSEEALTFVASCGSGLVTQKHAPEDVAYKWYAIAAEQGNKDAQLNLGLAYHNGKGLKQNHEKAFKWFKKAAEQGGSAAQDYVGVMYAKGLGVGQDYGKGVEWIKKAADQGNAHAQSNMGVFYQNGQGVLRDYGKAFEWFLKAAEQGDADGQVYLGSMYEHGFGVERDFEKASEWYKKAAEQGNAKGQCHMGNIFYHGLGVDQDYERAFDWYIKAAEQGDTAGQSILGDMYRDGFGVKQDYGKALNWYTKAAEKGDAYSQTELAKLYFDGFGVDQDYGKAFDWSEKSAEQGNTYGQVLLGSMYNDGAGVKQDYGKAFEWYMKAAEQGNRTGQYLLGKLYFYGSGVEQDYVKAFEWFTKAGNQGNASAQNMVGFMYDNGLSVEQDTRKAYDWYLKAAEQGNDMAQRNVGNLFYLEQDYNKAFDWYSRAAEQGNATCQLNLGVMYSNGLGVERDYEKAIEWNTKAAKNGETKALNGVAWIYHLMGEYENALPWAEKAVEANPDNPDIIDTLATVYEDLGHYDEAMAQFEKCLHLYEDGGNEEGRQRTVENIEALKKKMATGNK